MSEANHPDEALSQRPADILIRELIRTGRAAMPEEIARIIERMATAPFNGNSLSVPEQLRHALYQGRALHDRETALVIHLAQRIVGDGQWIADTTEPQYLADLLAAVRHPSAQLAVYRRRGGNITATLTPTDAVVTALRRGLKTLPWLVVVHSADRGIIVSGYQATGLQTMSIPGDARWLRR